MEFLTRHLNIRTRRVPMVFWQMWPSFVLPFAQLLGVLLIHKLIHFQGEGQPAKTRRGSIHSKGLIQIQKKCAFFGQRRQKVEDCPLRKCMPNLNIS